MFSGQIALSMCFLILQLNNKLIQYILIFFALNLLDWLQPPLKPRMMHCKFLHLLCLSNLPTLPINEYLLVQTLLHLSLASKLAHSDTSSVMIFLPRWQCACTEMLMLLLIPLSCCNMCLPMSAFLETQKLILLLTLKPLAIQYGINQLRVSPFALSKASWNKHSVNIDSLSPFMILTLSPPWQYPLSN